MSSSVYHVGNVYTNNHGEKFKIIDRVKDNYRKVKIKFLDDYGYEKEVFTTNIKRGRVTSPYTKKLFGVGFLGEGIYKFYHKQSKPTKEYSRWLGIIRRCYSDYTHSKSPNYKKHIVCDEWHNFQKFAQWYQDNYPHEIKDIKFDLDKDLKQQKLKNKIYSPETCLFLPSSVNSFLVNKSKNVKGYYFVNNKYRASITIFKTGEKVEKCFTDKEDAIIWYKNQRIIQATKVKNYLRKLSYLDEKIIDLIK